LSFCIHPTFIPYLNYLVLKNFNLNQANILGKNHHISSLQNDENSGRNTPKIFILSA